jgi:hypothetical protein
VIVVGDKAGILPGGWAGRTPLVLALTLLLASTTFYLVERPTRRITLRTFPRQRLVAVSGVLGAAVIALLIPAVLRVGAGAQALLEKAQASPGPLVAIRKTSADAPTTLLVGDSHADVLYPALARLAKEQGWSLIAASKWACPWPRVQATLEGVPVECESMRREALAAAAKTRPEVAVLVSHSIVVRPLQIGSQVVEPGDPGWIEEVDRGTASFLADLRPLVGRVVIIEPLPETTAPMIDCLATGAAPVTCSAPAVDQPGTRPLESSWRRLPGVTTVSLDKLICPERICSAMLDGVPTYRDTDHLTIPFSRHLAHALDAYLRLYGVVLAKGEVETS